jgi:hypothetical protein
VRDVPEPLGVHLRGARKASEVWSPCHTAPALRCPHAYWPGWPIAWPTCCHRAPASAAPRHLSLEVRLDAVIAVLLDGLSYRRAERAVGISRTEVGDSLDLLLGPLAALGYCQPDGTFITSLDDLRHWLGEMAKPARRSW